MLIEVDVVLGRVVRRIEIVRMRGVLSRERIDALDEGRDAERLAVSTDSELFGCDQFGDVSV